MGGAVLNFIKEHSRAYSISLFSIANSTIPQTGKVLKKRGLFGFTVLVQGQGPHLVFLAPRQLRSSHGKSASVGYVCVSSSLSLSLLIKLPAVFNHEGSTLMTLSNPSHFSKFPSLNTIVGLSFRSRKDYIST
jgi:hypothetical protein